MHGSQGKLIYSTFNGEPVVIKLSKYVDRSLELESKALEMIHRECPELEAHFPKFIAFTADNRLIMSRVYGNEMAEMCDDFYRSNCKNVRNKAVKLVRNMCFVTLCAMEIVRRKTGIIHNDLHCSNVMLVKTDKEVFHFEIDGKQFSFKSYGYCPVIIDFGTCYMEGPETLGGMANTDIGCFPNQPDLLADSRLLLCTTIGRFDKKFKEAVLAMFKPINLDKNGWFKNSKFTNVVDYVYDIARCEEATDDMDSKIALAISIMHTVEAEKNVSQQTLRDVFDALYDSEPLDKFDPSCKEMIDFAKTFKQCVNDVIKHNEEVLKIEYGKLSVKNGLDVLEELLSKCSCEIPT